MINLGWFYRVQYTSTVQSRKIPYSSFGRAASVSFNGYPATMINKIVKSHIHIIRLIRVTREYDSNTTKLTGELNHWINTNPIVEKTDRLPNKWKITVIADKFSDYHKDAMTPSLSINAFDGNAKKTEGGYANKGNKWYELRNKKQCACCKMAGHNIGDQVCRIGAQMRHATKYESANKETYQKIAEKYFKINRPVHINRVMRAHEEHTTEEEIMEECEEWITRDDEE
jgi:hypothetical protein